MSRNRVLPILFGLCAVLAAGWVLLTTRLEPPALIEPGPAPAVAEQPAAAPAMPAPALPRETRSVPAVEPLKHPLIPVDPYAGRDVHTLYGRVFDAATDQPVEFLVAFAAPVADGDIEYLARDNRLARIFRNSLGAFTIRGLERGSYNLLVRATGYQDVVLRDIALPSVEKELRVVVSRGAWIQAECVDEFGDGIGDVEVRLVPVRMDDPSGKTPRVQLQRTDNYGRALFSDLPTGIYHVRLLNEALNRYPSEDFYLGPGSNFPVRFLIDTANTLTVKVHDPDGQPVAHAHVRLWSTGDAKMTFRLETDKHGEAQCEFVPQGTYTMKLWKLGYKRLTRTMTITTYTGEHTEAVTLKIDPTGGEAEKNPTWEQIQRLKAGELHSDVFGEVEGAPPAAGGG